MKKSYICISDNENVALEIIASPMNRAQDETFTFKTEEAMTAFFDGHKEFELLHIKIVRASEAKTDDVQ